MQEAKDVSFDEIAVGDSVTFTRTWTEEDVRMFSVLSGDSNPLHMNETYASTTKFSKRLVHGMLLGSLCSQIVGMSLPGKRCLYLQQNLKFKQPVFIGETIIVFGEVTAKSESTKILAVGIIMRKK